MLFTQTTRQRESLFSKFANFNIFCYGFYLELGIEVYSGFSVEVVSRSDVGSLVTGKGKHGKGNRDGNIDSDLTSLNLMSKFSSGGTVVCENSSTVTPLVAVYDRDSLIKRLSLKCAENRSENFFLKFLFIKFCTKNA